MYNLANLKVVVVIITIVIINNNNNNNDILSLLILRQMKFSITKINILSILAFLFLGSREKHDFHQI